MPLVPVIAFCTAMSAGPAAPQPPLECIFIEDDDRYEQVEECGKYVTGVAENPVVMGAAAQLLFEQYAYTGTLMWYTWCHPQEDLRNFYTHFNVSDIGDIPQDL